MKTLGDEWYVVIKAYKLTVFDISRNFFVLSYIACPRYPYIRVYRLYDSSNTEYWVYYTLDIITSNLNSERNGSFCLRICSVYQSLLPHPLPHCGLPSAHTY